MPACVTVREAKCINVQIHASLHAGPVDEMDDRDDMNNLQLAANLGDSTLGELLEMGPADNADVEAAPTSTATTAVANNRVPETLTQALCSSR